MTGIYRSIATFWGAGNFPVAPGTVGSMATIPLYLIIRGLSLTWYLIVVGVFAVLGVLAAEAMEKEWGRDPSRVVIDEVVGMLLALAGRPKGLKDILYAFVLFRVFDIVKPPPVGTLDKGLHGGIGIMADDMAAGLLSALILKIMKVLGMVR
jgi:phosphatidylglycerophosphatase A